MTKKRVLIVEDEKIIAKYVENILKNFRYTVSGVVSTGEEAVQQISHTKPDLVLMDIMLKGDMDGIEAANQIRNFFNIPVVYMTSYADESTLQRAKITRPFGYIIKPVEARELYTTIEIALYVNKIERKLQESERWLTTVLKSINDAVIAVDTKGSITFMNNIAENLTGWNLKSVLGRELIDLFHIKREKLSTFPENPIKKVLREGNVIEMANSTFLVARNGKEIPIDYSIAPIKDDKRGITGAVLVFRDVTKRRKTENQLRKAYTKLKKMQQELIQSEKLAALGRFSSGFAHEIKNPLGIILGGIELIERKLPGTDKDVSIAIEKIKESTLRTDSIIQGLLKFARPSELITEIINPNDLINSTLSLLKYRAPLHNIKIDTQFTKEELYIEVDKNRMQQVLFNILMNAMEAMPEGGNLTIRSYKINQSEFLPDKSVCVIEIIDTGEGIQRENMQRLFEPFFTTKRDKKGTGLGLSMVKMIVEKHKGNLVIDSEPDKGTDVKLILPQAFDKVENYEREQKNPHNR